MTKTTTTTRRKKSTTTTNTDKPRVLESKIQSDILIWFRDRYPLFPIFSVPNEFCSFNRMAKAKKLGLTKGVSDLVVCLPGKVLFVELKTLKGRSSEEQIVFGSRVNRILPDSYFVLTSLEDFKSLIKSNLNF